MIHVVQKMYIDVNNVYTISCIHRSHCDVDDVIRRVYKCIDVNDMDTISCIHRSHRDVDDIGITL